MIFNMTGGGQAAGEGTELFRAGNTGEAMTGGWDVWASDLLNGLDADAKAGTRGRMDLTDYTALKCRVTVEELAEGAAAPAELGISASVGGTYGASVTAAAETGQAELTLDLLYVSGSYSVGLTARGAKIRVERIWLV